MGCGASSPAAADPAPAAADKATEDDEYDKMNEEEHTALFHKILRSESCNKLLMEEMKKAYSEQHLKFLQEIYKFKEEHTDADADDAAAKLASASEELIKRFIRAGTLEQINITEQQRMAIMKSSSQPSVTMFDEAQEAVEYLIKGNFYYKFIGGDEFRAWKRKS